MASHNQRQGEQLYRRHFPHHRFSLAANSSVVPDSQSPEPSFHFPPVFAHDHAPTYDHRPPAASRRSASTSLVPDSVLASPSRYTRSRSPSAIDPDERKVFKTEPQDDDMTDDERRSLHRSRVNNERARPRRRRERAPSYDHAVKTELDERLLDAAGRGGRAHGGDEAEEEEEGPMLPPGGARLPAVLRNKRPAPSRSPSPTRSVESSDSDDGITTPRSGTSSLFRPEEEEEDDDDDTPSEPRSSAHVAHRQGVPVKSKKKRKEKRLTKADRERESASSSRRALVFLYSASLTASSRTAALSFLDSLEPPPGPTFRPLGIKQRLINRAAESTAALPQQARVERVEVQPRSPSPPPQQQQDDLLRDLFGEADAMSGGRESTPPSGERSGPLQAGSPAGSLPDYDDDEDGPEAPLITMDDPVLLEEQGYFRRPTKEGAIRRWVVMLDRDKRPLPPLFDPTLLSSDLAHLRTVLLRLPPTLSPFRPSPDVALPCALPLLRYKPSSDTCADLWADLRSPAHAELHAQADRDAEPPRGRGCRCPVWAPPGGAREWAEERERVGMEEAAGIEGLVEVARRVFELGEDEGMRGEDLVGLVYVHNWIWYSQLLDLSRIASRSRLLASPQLVDDLTSHIDYTRGQHAAERKLAERRLEEDRARARDEGRLASKELWQETTRDEDEAENEERRLTELLARLEARLAEQSGRGAVRAEQEGARAGATREWLEQKGRAR
ncbi:hypothetical protein JCM9279_005580 [Rhodotorula babjevae]